MGGAVLGTAFLFPQCRFLVWVALVPFAGVLSRKVSVVVACAAGFLGGAMYHAVGLSWMLFCFDGVAAPVWFFSAVGGALGCAVVLTLGRAAASRLQCGTAIALPITWVGFEYSRHVFFRLLDGNGFPLLWLGLPLVEDLHFAQIADVVGVSGLTWIVAMANGALFDLAEVVTSGQPKRRATTVITSAMSATVCLLGMWLYGAWRVEEAVSHPGPTVALMPGTVPRVVGIAVGGPNEMGAEGKQLLLHSRLTSSPVTADLYAWPELSFSGRFFDGDLLAALESTGNDASDNSNTGPLAQLADSLGGAIIVGAQRRQQNPIQGKQWYNSAVYVLPAEGLKGVYDKHHRVPLLEFAPWWTDLLGHSVADRIVLSGVGQPQFERGGRCETFPLTVRRTGRTYRLAATICYDVCFADVHRQYMKGDRRQAADLFVCLMNESFDTGEILTRLTLWHTRLRAIECRRPYFRVSQGGISALIDSCGRVVRQTPCGTPTSVPVVGQVAGDLRRSAYATWGDWLPILCCVLLLGGFSRLPAHFPVF